MSERLTARSIETIRNLTESFPYNTFPNMLLVHIDALEAENTRLKAQVEAADALANGTEEIGSQFIQLNGIYEMSRELYDMGSELSDLVIAYRATATEES